LMGGQACVFYGAAEFSRDCDIAILCEPENLNRLRSALAELDAATIAVPPFEADYLLRGHAVHFRCRAPGAENIRLDVMSTMRGVDAFEQLWSRRTTIASDESQYTIELMSLPDLIAAKRTQRDKDWPIIRGIVEAHWAQHQLEATPEQLHFWFTASRTPEMLIGLAAKYPANAAELTNFRPLLAAARQGDVPALRRALADEQEAERVADELYWQPLKRELEELRHRGG
jgi:hypothetical protein